ncbi:MAG: diguanylate cyclase [Rudaea sp.]|uniref:diguanylate cyclase n=1 Tax=Rudaea sp. TaxID=2136325 RepID=UPI0039E5761C
MTAFQAESAKFMDHERQFVRRIYPLRLLGVVLSVICVAGVLRVNGASWPVWTALFWNGIFWPHLARWLALRSRSPRKAELRNLVVDAMFGGIWIAAMQFNFLPSVLLAVTLSFDRLALGGPKLLVRAVIAQTVACAATALVCGLRFRPGTTMAEIAMALPLLVAYPLAISCANYRLVSKMSRQNRHLAQLSSVDPLTGLLNRASWEEKTLDLLRRHQRLGIPAALLMIDIDNFKRINDEYGHLTGDEVIREVAGIIRRCIRDVDVPGRYGGDEFAIVLVQTGVETAMKVAERIRLSVLAGAPDGIPVSMSSVSIGIAANENDMNDARAWVKRADIALFEAKALGRDRVAIAH